MFSPGSDWYEPKWTYGEMGWYQMYGEIGFILKNETLVRFQPVGVTWDDSYCRSITDSGPSGCFIERDSYFENITDFDFQEVFGVLNFDQLGYNNCLEGKVEQDKCNSLRRLCFMKSTSLKKRILVSAAYLNGKNAKEVLSISSI